MLKPARFIYLILLSGVFFAAQAQYSTQFTGSTSYIRITDYPDLHLDEFTLACWIMPREGGTAISTGATDINLIPLISRGAHDPSQLQALNFRFGLRAEDNRLFLEFESWSEEEEAFISQHISGFTALEHDKWYHIAASFDGRYLRLYLNGILESMLEVFFQPESALSAHLGIAAAFNSVSAPVGSYRGKIDALRIFNRALSQSEILEFINSETLPGSANLILGFDFNEGSGSLLAPLGTVPAGNIYPQNISWSQGAHFNAMIPPVSDPDPIMTIGIISDPQYCDRETPVNSQRMYRETLNKLPVAIDTLNNREVDFTVTLGDVIDTFFVSYDSILPLYKAFENEYYFLLGNHDFAVEESEKPLVTGLLNMPESYYSLDRDKWRFLFLDGTELAGYTRVLHPEYADEGDSIRQTVSGEINDFPWNGGISRDQQAWIKDQIETAADEQRNLILFCHFPVLPDSVHLNLWNKDTIINLIRDYDHVVAYINGHFHEGGYDHRYGKHFLTHYAMVETTDSNSFSILSLYPSTLNFRGYGYNPDRILRYKDPFRELPFPQLDPAILHYHHSAGDFVARTFLPGYSGNEVNFALIGSSQSNDNGLFTIRNDSLFLLSSPDYLQQSDFNIRLGAIDYLHDSISATLNLQLDPRAAVQNYSLPDTTLNVASSFLIKLDSLFTDYTEAGLEYSFEVKTPDIIEGTQIDLSIGFVAQKYGLTDIFIGAFDSYTGTLIGDTFSVQVNDPFNTHPDHTDPDLLYVHFADTLRISADTLFWDADEDSLIFALAPPIDAGLHAIWDETAHLSLWADEAMAASVEITANDQRGGRDTLRLELKFNTPPVKAIQLDSLSLLPDDMPFEIMLDSVYLDPDQDELFYTLQYDCDILSAFLTDNLLSVEASDAGLCSLLLNVDDGFGGLLSDTLVIMFLPVHSGEIHSAPFESVQLFPNPASSFIQLRIELSPGIYHLRLFDELGITKIMQEVRPVAGEITHISLPVHSLGPGIYFLEISSQSEIPMVYRFIKIQSDQAPALH